MSDNPYQPVKAHEILREAGRKHWPRHSSTRVHRSKWMHGHPDDHGHGTPLTLQQIAQEAWKTTRV
jgi:hypothetical protein